MIGNGGYALWLWCGNYVERNGLLRSHSGGVRAGKILRIHIQLTIHREKE